MSEEKVFRFKKFELSHGLSGQKVTTDSVLLGSWIEASGDYRRILDVGAGTGLLSLMMAQKFPEAMIDAVEIDKLAADECERNFLNSPWPERLSLIRADFADLNVDLKYDFIVSNPPYFSEEILSHDQQRNIARHVTRLNVESLIMKGKELLTSNGSMAFVCPSKVSANVRFLGVVAGWKGIKECGVITREGKEVSLSLFLLSFKEGLEKESITIRDSEGRYTESYTKLTDDYYLFLH